MKRDILDLVAFVEEGLSKDPSFKDTVKGFIFVFKDGRWYGDTLFTSLDEVDEVFESFHGLQFLQIGRLNSQSKFLRRTSTPSETFLRRSWNEMNVNNFFRY